MNSHKNVKKNLKKPLKLFKNKHLKWEKELKKWNDKLSEAYQNLNDAIIEQETFM